MKMILFFFKIELLKFLKRKQPLYLFILTTIAYPLLIGTFIQVSFDELTATSQMPFEDTIAMVIHFTTSILLLPLWIAIFVSQEFQTNYVARFTFLHSRSSYFFSKVCYCFLVATYFSLLTLITAYFLFFTLDDVIISDRAFFIKLIPQVWFIYMLYALLSLSVVFLVRKTSTAILLMYFLPQVDKIIFLASSKFMNFHIPLGPFEMLRMLYSKNEIGFGVSYSNLIFDHFFIAILPIGYVSIIVFLVYRAYLRKDLKIISE